MCATRPDLAARPEPSDLVRGLGLWSATAIVIGDTIGSGIFLVSSDMARSVGSTRLVFTAWIIGGLEPVFFAVCYCQSGAGFSPDRRAARFLHRSLRAL